jgi:hypothetical protein
MKKFSWLIFLVMIVSLLGACRSVHLPLPEPREGDFA